MTTTLAENKNIESLPDPEIKAMIDAGVHIGHTKTKRHPLMEPYIWTVRNGISIIDVTKTKPKLEEACEFLKGIAAKRDLILFVGTRPAARKIIEEHGRALGMPYVGERWIGGTLTNHKVIAKRIETLITLEGKLAAGELEKYPKKERMQFEKEILRLKVKFDGLRILNRLPAAIFVVNVPYDEVALREAVRMRIPIVALVDTNSDPRHISYPIPSNDDALPALHYMLDRIARSIREGKEEAARSEQNTKE